MKKPTVTVITSSIGRPELKQCVESVMAQTFPCKHMIFINGEKWHRAADEVLSQFTPMANIQSIKLKEETGDCGVGPGAGDVFAAAPWLTTSDFVFFLNDDDFYETNHVESILTLMVNNNLDWAYSLRRFVDKDGKPFCEDDFDSLGFWPCVYSDTQFLVDNSCYAMRRSVAKQFGPCWLTPAVGDRAILRAMKQAGLSSGCTGLTTVNYRVGGSAPPPDADYYKINTERIREKHPEGFPWRKPTVFRMEAKK